MKLVIAEKPSVARELARLLGVHKKHDGYMSSDDYLVTWALGHLLALAMPEDYGWSGFFGERLPLIPSPFKLVTRKSKVGKSYKDDEGASKQLKIIEQLIKRSDSIVVATDAGREGELIFRYIYNYLECKLPFERLWISSLTEKSIKNGLNNLRNGREFDQLYKAGESRSRADWLVGINASQALTIACGDSTHSLGRVQTPTLCIVCKRYLDHSNFSSDYYYQLQLSHKKEFIEFKTTSVGKWEDKGTAEKILKNVLKGNSVVVSVTTKNLDESAPLLFDITGLQKECNRQLGITAEETLLIAQGLYEKKFITYPRTGSKYIPEDMWPEIPKLVRAFDDKLSLKVAASKVKWGRFNDHIVNGLRVTDHHGLLTTEIIPIALNGKENAVYDMIALRILESISHKCNKIVTDIVVNASGNEFTAKGMEVLDAGWRSIRGDFHEEGEAPLIQLPELENGDRLKIHESKLLSKKTKPPSLYTEATLLSSMEFAGKKLEDTEQRQVILPIGIGTPATRAAIIGTLIKRDYIQRNKKSLVPTPKGLQVYKLVKDRKISDIAMTAEWEHAFSQIENGEKDADLFQKEIEEYAGTITSELLSLSILRENVPELACPKCKKSKLFIREKIAKCSDDECGWLQYRIICGVNLTIEDLKKLVETGKTNLLKGLKTKSGKKFNAFIVLKENFETSFEFEKKTAPKNK